MTIEFGNTAEPIKVPALVIEVDEVSIRDYLALSDELPLVVTFIGSDQASAELLKTLTALTEKLSGEILTLVIDAHKQPQLAKAFEVTQLPSVFGLLKGQPAPLFAGNQPAEQIQLVLSRVLEVAKENGLNQKVSVEIKLEEPELTENQKLAFELIDKGEYQEAKALYERAILENPSDSLSEAGLAQVNLLIRLKDLDINKAQVDEDPLIKADALIATGQADEGFDLLLELFQKSAKEDREALRLRLVELFLVVGTNQPSVIAARRKLSLLLF